jgi:trimethylamine--corrinoid protein Co-methyltransferase
MVIRILRGISISDETLALNIIEKADHEAEFLKYEHTRKFFRSEHWLPRVMFRGSWETFDKSRETIIQTARRRMTQIWKEREPQGLPEDKARELAAIAAEAEKELLTKT